MFTVACTYQTTWRFAKKSKKNRIPIRPTSRRSTSLVPETIFSLKKDSWLVTIRGIYRGMLKVVVKLPTVGGAFGSTRL